MTNTVISYPTPPYSNPPIHSEFFEPNYFFISDVTLGQTTIVETAVDMNFVVGQLCRLLFPKGYGCGQINEMTGYVVSIPSSNEVELNIYSANADPFKASTNTTQPTIVPVGDVNTGQVNANGSRHQELFIPGSFITVS